MSHDERGPVRLQLSRRKGFNLQALSRETNGLEAVKVARRSWWGNPYNVGEDHTYYGGPGHEKATAAQCVELFRHHEDALRSTVPARHAREMARLRGKNLACFCALDAPCHADVLLDLANRPTCESVS